MDQRKGLLTIGVFASAARLSIKALRLYDKLGVLSPRFTDSRSGYRYYHFDQLHRARLIRVMREMEMPLLTIRQMLAATPAEAEKLVGEYLHTRENRLETARKLLPKLTQLLRTEATMSLQVNVKRLESLNVVSVTRRVKVNRLVEVISQSVNQLNAFVTEQGGATAGSPFGIYHGTINTEDDGPIEICVPVVTRVEVKGDISFRKMAGGKAAAVLLYREQCDFPEVLKGYDAVIDWIKQNGYKAAQSPREIWLGQEGPEMKLEVVWPFR